MLGFQHSFFNSTYCISSFGSREIEPSKIFSSSRREFQDNTMTSDGYEKRPSVRSFTKASSEGDFHAIIDGSHPSLIILNSLHLLTLASVVIDGISERLIISLITVTKVRLFFEICKKNHNYFSIYFNYFCKEYLNTFMPTWRSYIPNIVYFNQALIHATT